MIWDRAARRRDELQVRLVAMETAIARLGDAQAENERREERWLAFAAAKEREAEEKAIRLADLSERVEALEVAWDDARDGERPMTETRLAAALEPLKLEIASIALQTAADERQAQRAYLELVGKVERLGRTTDPTSALAGVPAPARASS